MVLRRQDSLGGFVGRATARHCLEPVGVEEPPSAPRAALLGGAALVVDEEV